MSASIEPTYLPFTPEELLPHFAEVSEAAGDPERLLTHFHQGAAAYESWQETVAAAWGRGLPLPRPSAEDVQVEKDERFWVATGLLSLFHAPDRVGALSDFLTRCFGDAPPVDGLASWPEALGSEQHLFFEAHLPSPRAYQTWLRDHLEERVLTPTALRVAKRTGRLEGSTTADAVLVAPGTGFSVVFEAKVLADASPGIAFDVLRNQLVRTIDVLLDEHHLPDEALAARRPDRTCVALLTPEVFRSHRSSRLYGHLFDLYRRSPETIGEHLPHRQGIDWSSVSRRLGWGTWEDVNRALPGALPWL